MCSLPVKIATRQQYSTYLAFSKELHACIFVSWFFSFCFENPTHVLTTLSKTGIILNFLGPDSFKHHDAPNVVPPLSLYIYGLCLFSVE